MEELFTNIYEKSLWGDNCNQEYNGSSGGGSDVDFNKDTYIPFLKKYICYNEIKTVVDLGCGDFRCGPVIYNDLNVTYTGYDAYCKLVEYNSANNDPKKYTFHHLDFCNKKEEIIGGDLCILKDVVQHWSLHHINAFLDYLVESKKFKHILITNCGHQTVDNTDIETGDWRALSCDFFPLKKYRPMKLYIYGVKEISVIKGY